MRRSIKFSTSLVAAVLAVVLLAGAAFAAAQLNIWEALNNADPIIPLEGADELVATDLAVAENEYFRILVQEAVYDGYGAIVKIKAEPVNPDTHIILANYMIAADVPNLDEYIIEENTTDGIGWSEIIGRKDGKEIIWLGTPQPKTTNVDPDKTFDLFNSYRDQANPDGSLDIWITGTFANDLPDTLNINLSTRGMDAEYNTVYGSIENLTFDLIKNNRERTVQLTPAGGSQIDGFELVDARITFTEVRGYISVEYTGSAEEQDTGVSLRLLDKDGNQITTGSGQCMELENGHFRWELEMQSFDEIPETMILEVRIIDEGAIGQIECNVEEITK